MWKKITEIALLGTKRSRPLEILPSKDPLHQLVRQVPNETIEMNLLLQAAVLTLHEQNGRLPEQIRVPLPPLPQAEKRPSAPQAVITYLDDVLYGPHVTLLADYLAALDQAGFRIPRQYLPNLLDKGVKTVKLRPVLLRLIGNQGRWLAHQNPAWAYAAPDIYTWQGLLRYWDEHDIVKRKVLLSQLRENNPELGRKILANFWRSSTDVDRQQLINVLETNLTMADEPFLEAALDDRSHLVRRKAVDLLAGLPGSRHSQRMITYAAGVLQMKLGRLYIYFPEMSSPQMIRDGIIRIDNQKNLARLRTRQLNQLISSVPLDHWSEMWQLPIRRILEEADSSKWPRTLLNAFTTAAYKQNNQAWIQAILLFKSFNSQVARLLRRIDHEVLEEMVQQNQEIFRCDIRPLRIDHPMYSVLQQHQEMWSAPLSRFWLQQFAHTIKAQKDTRPINVQLKILLSRLLAYTTPPLLDEAEQLLAEAVESSPHWRSPVRQMLAKMRFRQQMMADIQSAKERTVTQQR